MADTSITVNVSTKLEVDQRTAETCLRLVEAYINRHRNIGIACEPYENGEYRLRFNKIR
jgi:predicted aconitase